MTDVKELRVGLIGLGFIGKVHANAYRAIPLCFSEPAVTARVAAVLRSKISGEAAFLHSLGDPLVTTDPDEFFNQALDVVDICTPNYLHVSEAVESVRRGIPTYCEKPLANNLEEARQMADAARQAGVLTHTAFVMRYLPAMAQAKALLEAGAIGRVLNFRANMFHSSYLDVNRPMSWRLRKVDSGGGVFADLGAHLVDMLRYLLGDVARLRAETRTYITDRPVKKGEAQHELVDVDDWALATLELESGPTGVVEVTRMAAGAGEDTSIQIFGSQGALVFQMAHPELVQYYDLKAQKWMSGALPLAALSNGRPNEKLWAPAKMTQGMMTNVHLASQYDMLQSIVEGKPTWLSFDEAAKTQEVIEGVYLSAARNGERVDLPL